MGRHVGNTELYLSLFKQFLPRLAQSYGAEQRQAVEDANKVTKQKSKGHLKQRTHWLGLRSISFEQRLRVFMYNNDLQAVASILVGKPTSKIFGSIKQIPGRSKTAFQCDITNDQEQKIRTLLAENETWGYMTRGKKNCDLQVGKMFLCQNKQMQQILLEGRNTSIMKFTLTYHLNSELEAA